MPVAGDSCVVLAGDIVNGGLRSVASVSCVVVACGIVNEHPGLDHADACKAASKLL